MLLVPARLAVNSITFVRIFLEIAFFIFLIVLDFYSEAKKVEK